MSSVSLFIMLSIVIVLFCCSVKLACPPPEAEWSLNSRHDLQRSVMQANRLAKANS